MKCLGMSKSKAMYMAETNFGRKAQLMLERGQKTERKTTCFGGRIKYLKKSVKAYDTYNRCMAVHLFRETNRKNLQEMMTVCSNARSIVQHRKNIITRILMKSRKYKPAYVQSPGQLSPVQWSCWVDMCSSTGPIEYHLRRMGLLPHMTVLEEQIAIASASAVSITNNNTNTMTGPMNTNTISGPTMTANPVMNSNPNITLDHIASPITESYNNDSVKRNEIPATKPYAPFMY